MKNPPFEFGLYKSARIRVIAHIRATLSDGLFVFLIKVVVNRCFDKSHEQRMGFIGTAFEFRVKLNTDVEGFIGQFNRFHQLTVGRNAAEDKPERFQLIAVQVVELIAVTVAFINMSCSIAALHRASGLNFTGIAAQAQRTALVDFIALSRHEVDHRVRRTFIEFMGIGSV